MIYKINPEIEEYFIEQYKKSGNVEVLMFLLNKKVHKSACTVVIAEDGLNGFQKTK